MPEEEPKVDLEQEEDERRESQADALIVFGFGIDDPYWKKKMVDRAQIKALPGEIDENSEMPEPGQADLSTGWMLSLGAKMRVQAAAELYLRGATREVIFTGGATRQEKDGLPQTEAALMEDYFLHILKKRKLEELKSGREKLTEIDRRDIEQAVDAYIETAKENLTKEDKATNTIENFSRTLSKFDANPEKYRNGSILLTNRFHAARLKQLAEQFLIQGKVFNAEDVISYARAGKRHQELVNNVIDRYTDPNSNEEYRKYLFAENRWSRGLKEVPEYFLPQTIFVEGKRLKEILKSLAKAEEKYEKKLEELGIIPGELDDYSPDQMDEVQDKLSKIDRMSNWPPESWASANPPK